MGTETDQSERVTMKEKSKDMNDDQMLKYTRQLEQNAKAILKDKTNFTRIMTIPKYLEEAPPEGWEERWKMAHVMESRGVKLFLVILIVANAVCIGLQADYGGDANMWLGIEVIFLVCFCSELVLNCYSFGWLYFQDPWHHLDTGIVVISVIDFIYTVSVGAGEGSTGLSVIRLVRAIRVLRVISHSDKMAQIMASFGHGMQNLSWVLVLLILMLYIFSVMAKSFFGESSKLKADLAAKEIDAEDLFGSIPRSMVTLLGMSTFDDTVEMQRAIGNTYPVSWVFFLVFMIFVSIGMMELMNAIFIESLMEEKKRIEAKHMNDQLEKRDKVKDMMVAIFNNYDVDTDGTLDTEELKACMGIFQDPEIQELLDHVGISSIAMAEALETADIDATGTVSAEEFRTAIDSVHMEPSRLHIAMMQQQMTIMQNKLLLSFRDMNGTLQKIEERLDRLEAKK